MKATKHATAKDYIGPGPVQKIQFLAKVASLKSLSRADLAALITLTDMINPKTGLAWPSYKTIAARCGCTDRHAKATVKGLVEKKLLRIVSHGNKIRSNRYAIETAAEILNTNLCSATENTSLVLSRDISGDAEQHIDVNHASPQPIHEPEHQAREEMNGLSSVDATPSGAFRPSGLHQTNADKFPEFWDAFPLRAKVLEAEQLITELIHEGANYSEIVDGAARYASYSSVTGGMRRTSAPAWLEKQSWRDSWEHPKQKQPHKQTAPQKQPQKASEKKCATSKKTETNPDYKRWRSAYTALWDQRRQIHQDMEEHIGPDLKIKCKACKDYMDKPIDDLCKFGQKKRLAHQLIERQLQVQVKIKPPKRIRVQAKH